jgi:hypothetical protein
MRFRYLISIVLLIELCSCGTGLRISASAFKPLSHDYSGVFDNEPYLTKGTSYLSKEKFSSLTLLNHFDSLKGNSKFVLLSFNTKEQLIVTCKDSLKTETSTFNGKFSKKGYYEIFFRKEVIEIPPLIPIFFSRRNINRIRISLTNHNDLVIDRKRVLDGNVFLFGGGSSDRTQNFFHPSIQSTPQ